MPELSLIKIDFSVPVTLGPGGKLDPPSFIERLSARWKGRRVAVFGITGSGKTAWLKYVWKINIPETDVQSTTLDTEPYSAKIGRLSFIFEDSPGQDSNASLLEMLTRARDGDYLGVINLVSYGFQDSQGDSKKKFGKKKDIEEYTKKVRENEVNFVRKFLFDRGSANADGLIRNLKFVITVVNKFDLWHPLADEVRAHYVGGPYGEVLQPFGNRHVVCACAAGPQFGYFHGSPVGGVWAQPPDQSVIGDVNGACIMSIGAALRGHFNSVSFMP